MWATDNSQNWHALFVVTGQEEVIKKALEDAFGDEVKLVVPKREIRERKAGKWRLVKRNLFPGYILLKGSITVEAYNRIKKIPLAVNLLKSEEGPLKIEEKELEVLNILMDNEDGNIGISTVFKEGEKVKVNSGPLVGLEGHIQGVDMRKGWASVRISFLGEERTVQLGIDLVDKTCNNS